MHEDNEKLKIIYTCVDEKLKFNKQFLFKLYILKIPLNWELIMHLKWNNNNNKHGEIQAFMKLIY